MIYDISRTERIHRAIQSDNRQPMSFTMRTCAGACRRQRSVGQFESGSAVCIRCARRAVGVQP